jgi:hypothetical protein
MSGAARKKLLRARQRAGVIVCAVEVDTDAIEALIVARLLPPTTDHEDRDAVGHAIEALLRIVGRDASRHILP